MRRAARSLLVFLVFVSGLSIARGLSAHDLWIEPSNFRPAEAQLFAVRLRVGEAFKGDPVPRMEERHRDRADRSRRAVYRPDPARAKAYEALYAEYRTLHDYFGTGGNDVLHRLRRIRNEARR